MFRQTAAYSFQPPDRPGFRYQQIMTVVKTMMIMLMMVTMVKTMMMLIMLMMMMVVETTDDDCGDRNDGHNDGGQLIRSLSVPPTLCLNI